MSHALIQDFAKNVNFRTTIPVSANPEKSGVKWYFVSGVIYVLSVRRKDHDKKTSNVTIIVNLETTLIPDLVFMFAINGLCEQVNRQEERCQDSDLQ